MDKSENQLQSVLMQQYTDELQGKKRELYGLYSKGADMEKCKGLMTVYLIDMQNRIRPSEI